MAEYQEKTEIICICQKRHGWYFYDDKRIVLIDYFEMGQNIIAEYYANLLTNYMKKSARPDLNHRRKMLSSIRTRIVLALWKSTDFRNELLERLPYSPDLTFSKFIYSQLQNNV